MKNTKCQESQHRNFNYRYRIFVILLALAALFAEGSLAQERPRPGRTVPIPKPTPLTPAEADLQKAHAEFRRTIVSAMQEVAAKVGIKIRTKDLVAIPFDDNVVAVNAAIEGSERITIEELKSKGADVLFTFVSLPEGSQIESGFYKVRFYFNQRSNKWMAQWKKVGSVGVSADGSVVVGGADKSVVLETEAIVEPQSPDRTEALKQQPMCTLGPKGELILFDEHDGAKNILTSLHLRRDGGAPGRTLEAAPFLPGLDAPSPSPQGYWICVAWVNGVCVTQKTCIKWDHGHCHTWLYVDVKTGEYVTSSSWHRIAGGNVVDTEPIVKYSGDLRDSAGQPIGINVEVLTQGNKVLSLETKGKLEGVSYRAQQSVAALVEWASRSPEVHVSGDGNSIRISHQQLDKFLNNRVTAPVLRREVALAVKRLRDATNLYLKHIGEKNPEVSRLLSQYRTFAPLSVSPEMVQQYNELVSAKQKGCEDVFYGQCVRVIRCTDGEKNWGLVLFNPDCGVNMGPLIILH